MRLNNKPSRRIVLITLFCLAVLLVAAKFAISAPNNADFVFTILHTNDLHAHDQSFVEQGKDVGGMARIGYLIKHIRQTTPNVVTIDAGDIFQGTPFFGFYHGAVEVALLNMIGYDLYTPGNHEFDEGPENLAKQLSNAHFAIISANLDAQQAPDLNKLIKTAVVKVIDGHKVGFVGAITPDLEQISLTLGNVHLKQTSGKWINPIKQEVEKLKEQGITHIVLITHVGVERDKELADAIPDIDVIIGGHSHTRLNKPIEVTHADGTKTIIVQTGSYGRALGKLKLAFDKQGHVIPDTCAYHLINITDRITQDADIASYLNDKAKPLLALKAKIAGYALLDFNSKSKQWPWDSPLGDLICDALANAGATYGANISFENRGGIRSGIEKGSISLEKVEEMLPFANHVVFATVSGKTIMQLLEHSVAKDNGGQFLDVHGLKFAYDPDKPPGSRILFAMACDKSGQWHNVNLNDNYKIAINSYNFKGGEGYDFTQATNVKTSDKRVAEAFSSYLQKVKTVKPNLPERIVPVVDSLFSLVKHNGKQVLQVHCPMAKEQLTLIVGQYPGVESIVLPQLSKHKDCPGQYSEIERSIPVPLAHVHVVESVLVANADDYSFALPLTMNEKLRSSAANWAALIINPIGKTAKSAIKISYPVMIHQAKFVEQPVNSLPPPASTR